MKTSLFLMTILMTLFSCSNEDDSQNIVYKEKYERRFIIFRDSLGIEEKDSGTVRVSKNNTLYSFNFETANNKHVDPIEDIEMEMTGSNSLRNVNWSPTKFIVMTKDSINISYQVGDSYWLVNGIK
ncbi:hypothetical protein OBK30_02450 [Empedobacter falsenii]